MRLKKEDDHMDIQVLFFLTFLIFNSILVFITMMIAAGKQLDAENFQNSNIIEEDLVSQYILSVR